MKHITRVFTFILTVLLSVQLVLPAHAQGEVKESSPAQTQMLISPALIKSNCDPKTVIDPNAPCTAVPFSKSTTNINITTVPATRTQVLVCGVNLLNAFNTVVMTLSENVSVTWDAYGYTINWATRSTWVLNSAYQWQNLNGPNPASGHGNVQPTWVDTTGSAYYLGGFWSNHLAQTYVVGNQSNGSWSCTGTY